MTFLFRRNIRRGSALVTLLLLALVLAACAGQSSTGETTTGATAEATESLGLGEPDVMTTPEAGMGTPAGAMTTPGAEMATPAGEATLPAAGTTAAGAPTDSAKAATVIVTENKQFGEILTDAEGMTLYLFTKDTPNTSTCYNQCATNWPPLLTTGEAQAGEGVDGRLLGTTERTDGTTQVTYNGWPLYYWAQDASPGDATGQGVGDVWYVVSPEGDMIEGAGQ